MRFEIQKPGERGMLTLEGDLTIANAEETRNALLDALGSVSRLEYDVKNVTAVDLSFLQILCSAHRTALDMGKELVLSADFTSEVLSDTAKSAGYVRHIGCDRENLNSCLWLVDNEKQR
jgi:anti-anti-sigma regulatory factor